MITLPLHHDATLRLPDCREELTPQQALATAAILTRLLSAQITPLRARLEMLVRYTRYRPSLKFADPATREARHYNLLQPSELLTFAFALALEAQTIRPRFNFRRNPLPELTIDGEKYKGEICNLDIITRTDITAREFADVFDLPAAFTQMTDEARRDECLNQLCAILYPAVSPHRANLVSGQSERMRNAAHDAKTQILYRFTGIVRHYTEHPLYGILFSGAKKNDEGDEKIHLGARETLLFLTREGYGDPDTMNLNDYFDAQLKAFKDTISHALAQGVKIEKIALETGLTTETLNKLH